VATLWHHLKGLVRAFGWVLPVSALTTAFVLAWLGSAPEARGQASSGSSLSLNGTTAYAEAPQDPELNPGASWTVELWFRDETPGGYNHPRSRLLTKGDPATAAEAPYFLSVDTGSLYAGLRAGGTATTVRYDLVAHSVSANDWHHAAATLDAPTHTLALYVDGAAVVQGAVGAASAGSTDPVEIGRSGASGSYWRGKIDDVRIWSVVRSPADIANAYQTELTTAAPGLVANWRFDEGSGATAADATTPTENATLLGGVAWFTDTPSAAGGPPATATPSTSTTPTSGFAATATATGTALPTDPATVGQWGAPMGWPLVAIHAAMLPTGEVMLMDHEIPTRTRLWDPATGAFTTLSVPGGLFCSAHTLLADGRLLVIGGHIAEAFDTGNRETNIYDPFSRSWTRGADMNYPRWYPSATELSDGRVLVLSGQNTDNVWADTPEIYDPVANTWSLISSVSTADFHDEGYPLAHLLPNGQVQAIAPTGGVVRLFDTATQRWINAGANPMPLASTAMYRPGRILAAGGGNPSVDSTAGGAAETINMTGSPAAWTATGSMAFGRYDHNLESWRTDR
jgi:hypothetical protein